MSQKMHQVAGCNTNINIWQRCNTVILYQLIEIYFIVGTFQVSQKMNHVADCNTNL